MEIFVEFWIHPRRIQGDRLDCIDLSWDQKEVGEVPIGAVLLIGVIGRGVGGLLSYWPGIKGGK